MILKIIIILLMFVSVGILAYKGIPYFSQRYSQTQKRRMERASEELNQMFIFTEKRRLLPVFTITPLVSGVLGFILLQNPLGIFLGLMIGLVLPTIWIKTMFVKRKRDFVYQLIDGLMLVSSSLRAGMSLTQAIEVLAQEMPPPISDEFALVLRENQMGVALEDCLAHLKQRMPIEELDLINIAVAIARETGGNLTEIFGRLVFTIREKRKLTDRVRTLTVQGRLQGIIMAILPIVFGIFIYFINPRTFQVMLEDELGRMLLVGAVIAEVIGLILIRQLSRVEV